jgi:hypothetical protein
LLLAVIDQRRALARAAPPSIWDSMVWIPEAELRSTLKSIQDPATPGVLIALPHAVTLLKELTAADTDEILCSDFLLTAAAVDVIGYAVAPGGTMKVRFARPLQEAFIRAHHQRAGDVVSGLPVAVPLGLHAVPVRCSRN